MTRIVMFAWLGASRDASDVKPRLEAAGRAGISLAAQPGAWAGPAVARASPAPGRLRGFNTAERNG